MLQDGSTIIIPMRGQPHLLIQAIAGLRAHSVVWHRIAVVYSDAPVSDWAVDQCGQAYRHVENMQDVQWYLAECGLDEGVEFFDVTAECETEPSWPPADGAWKSNYGLQLATTPWVCPAWDADYYPLPEWDQHMIEAMEATDGRGVYVPRFCDPHARPVTVPVGLPEHPAVFPGWHGYLTEADVREAQRMCDRGTVATWVEPGNVLAATGWADTSIALNPQWWPTDILGGEVPIPEMGKTPEWELSKKIEACDLRRRAHSRSFILHKYSVVGGA